LRWRQTTVTLAARGGTHPTSRFSFPSGERGSIPLTAPLLWRSRGRLDECDLSSVAAELDRTERRRR
jgi:hypothetical protein